ncbi:MAG: TIGR00296 family protein [Thermoplasmata archaeon]
MSDDPEGEVPEPLGAAAVRLARFTVEESSGGPVGPAPEEPLSAAFRVPRGVFVTLRTHPGERLRGCIGFPLPVFPLGRAIRLAAAAAAREDPRFPPVSARELNRLTVEVSVLTVPEPLAGRTGAARREALCVGTDGLIVEAGGRTGLLLPQVATEQGWDARQFLAGACEKAGLPPEAWESPATRLLTFRARIFREASPGGPIVRGG